MTKGFKNMGYLLVLLGSGAGFMPSSIMAHPPLRSDTVEGRNNQAYFFQGGVNHSAYVGQRETNG